MKRFLVAFVAIAAILAVTVPASALEVKYGGLFRARIINQSDFPNVSLTGAVNDGTLAYTDHMNRLDQRLRIYMYFVASENLRLVTKFEANTVWGDSGTTIDPTTKIPSGTDDIVGGGNVGADVNNFGIKNAYIDFAIPNTPARAFVGVQGIALQDSWIVDSDFSAAVVQAKLDPVKITAGYAAALNYNYLDENENVDDFFLAIDYVGGPFRASLNFFYQYGHDTLATVFPQIMNDPTYTKFAQWPEGMSFSPFFLEDESFTLAARDNQFFDLGVSLGYKIDYLSAYFNFVKNFGSVELWAIEGDEGSAREFDYTGWMIDAGLTYFCGPWTFNIGGFYTTGQDVKIDTEGSVGDLVQSAIELSETDEIHWFTYPLGTVKYFSEIMGGGILDNTAPNGGLWKGYQTPFNIWTVTVGAAWQVLPQTKLSASYWYFGTSEEVPVLDEHALFGVGWSNDLGHEFDFYLTQGIVDKLTLDLVAAYMVTGDAFDLSRDLDDDDNSDDVYELGARLQWSF